MLLYGIKKPFLASLECFLYEMKKSAFSWHPFAASLGCAPGSWIFPDFVTVFRNRMAAVFSMVSIVGWMIFRPTDAST
jgi:hypothetical protein